MLPIIIIIGHALFVITLITTPINISLYIFSIIIYIPFPSNINISHYTYIILRILYSITAVLLFLELHSFLSSFFSPYSILQILISMYHMYSNHIYHSLNYSIFLTHFSYVHTHFSYSSLV